MRSRKQILSETGSSQGYEHGILEVLLDIRDLLMKEDEVALELREERVDPATVERIRAMMRDRGPI